jgi:hypothetical protein
MNALSQGDDFSTIVKFNTKSLSIREIMSMIEETTAFRFSYVDGQVPVATIVSLSSKNITLKAAVEQLCTRGNLNYIRKGNLIILQRSKNRNKVTLSGSVLDEATGEVLPGAQLLIANSGEGVITNRYGFFSLTQSAGAQQRIKVSFI